MNTPSAEPADINAAPAPSKRRPAVERLAYRLDEIRGCSASRAGPCSASVRRESSPSPDVRIGSTLLWSCLSIDAYVKQGGRGR